MDRFLANDTFGVVLDYLAPKDVCTIASSETLWDPCLASDQVYKRVKKKLGIAALLDAVGDDQSRLSARRVVRYFHPTIRHRDWNVRDKAEDVLMEKVSDEILDSYDFLCRCGPDLSSSVFCAIATKRLMRDAKNGDAIGQLMLGLFYENGVGVDRDEAKAVELFRLAADQGNPRAQNSLGVCYQSGNGSLARDEVEAVRLYRLAADQGYSRAQCNLGVCNKNGKGGLERNEVEAVRLYRLAADQGDADGQFHLACYYLVRADYVKEEHDEALRLLHLAIDQGHDRAATIFAYIS